MYGVEYLSVCMYPTRFLDKHLDWESREKEYARQDRCRSIAVCSYVCTYLPRERSLEKKTQYFTTSYSHSARSIYSSNTVVHRVHTNINNPLQNQPQKLAIFSSHHPCMACHRAALHCLLFSVSSRRRQGTCHRKVISSTQNPQSPPLAARAARRLSGWRGGSV